MDSAATPDTPDAGTGPDASSPKPTQSPSIGADPASNSAGTPGSNSMPNANSQPSSNTAFDAANSQSSGAASASPAATDNSAPGTADSSPLASAGTAPTGSNTRSGLFGSGTKRHGPYQSGWRSGPLPGSHASAPTSGFSAGFNLGAFGASSGPSATAGASSASSSPAGFTFGVSGSSSTSAFRASSSRTSPSFGFDIADATSKFGFGATGTTQNGTSATSNGWSAFRNNRSSTSFVFSTSSPASAAGASTAASSPAGFTFGTDTVPNPYSTSSFGAGANPSPNPFSTSSFGVNTSPNLFGTSSPNTKPGPNPSSTSSFGVNLGPHPFGTSSSGANNSSNVFGTTSFRANTDSNLFGTSSFGAGANPSPNPFSTSSFGVNTGSNLFGTSSPDAKPGPNPSSTSSFGVNLGPHPFATSSSGANNSSNLFGTTSFRANTDSNLFGTSSFGVNTGPNLFGASGPNAKSGPNPSSTSSFGVNLGPHPFGTSSSGANNSSNLFGTTSFRANTDSNLFGTSSFGAGADPSPNPFGTSSFGAHTGPNPFGSSSPTDGTSFGFASARSTHDADATAPHSNPYATSGSSAPFSSFDASNTSIPSSGFGFSTSSSSFNGFRFSTPTSSTCFNSVPNPSVLSAFSPVVNIPWRATQSSWEAGWLQSISAMPEYAHLSFDELRWKLYQGHDFPNPTKRPGFVGSSTTPPFGFGAAGTTSPAHSSTSGATSSSPAFGFGAFGSASSAPAPFPPYPPNSSSSSFPSSMPSSTPSFGSKGWTYSSPAMPAGTTPPNSSPGFTFQGFTASSNPSPHFQPFSSSAAENAASSHAPPAAGTAAANAQPPQSSASGSHKPQGNSAGFNSTVPPHPAFYNRQDSANASQTPFGNGNPTASAGNSAQSASAAYNATTAKRSQLPSGVFRQVVPHAAPRLPTCAAASTFRDYTKASADMAQMLPSSTPLPCLKQSGTCPEPTGQAKLDLTSFEDTLKREIFMSAEFEDWHSEVKWMQQTPVWPAGFKAKFKIEDIPWSYTCLLVQPCHMVSYLKDQEQLTGAPGQHLTIARLQRFVTATSRITMQQRLQLVFQGYRARFAQIGVGSQDDLRFLEAEDVSLLKLPLLAEVVLTTCLKLGMCRPPFVFEFANLLKVPEQPIQELLNAFGLGSCAPLFWTEQLFDLKDLMMLEPQTQLQVWEDSFALKLPFRKLCKLLMSLPCNMLWLQLSNSNWLAGNCCISDLLLYDSESVWKQLHAADFTTNSSTQPLLSMSAFSQQAHEALEAITDSDKLQSIWSQYDTLLQKGLGLSTAEDLQLLGLADLDEFLPASWMPFFPLAISHCLLRMHDERPDRSSRDKAGPSMAEMAVMKPSGLGSLMDWLTHADVELGAYFPFFKAAGICEVQHLCHLSIDAVQPYMLPWHVRKLLRCLNGLLAPQYSTYGYFEPSLFCPLRPRNDLPEDAQWLIKTFFVHYTTELAELDVPLTNSVDTPFLTRAVLEDINWEHQPSCGSAWHQAVESALLGMSLENRYALLKQRFPRALSAAGVNTADDMRWLTETVINTSLGQLPRHVVFWLCDFARSRSYPAWKPFHFSSTLSAEAQLEAWQKHANVILPACLGARHVADLQHVDARVQLTLRPVQQAKLVWALKGYREQLRQEQQGESAARRAADAARAEFRQQEVNAARPEAQRIVQDVYKDCKRTHDVHAFVEQLSEHYPKLDATLLPVKTQASIGSSAWRADMLKIVKRAILMTHFDKAGSGVSATQEAFSMELTNALLDWKRSFS